MKRLSVAVIVAIVLFLLRAPAQALELGIFADVSFNESTESETTSAFALGGMVLYAHQQIGEHTKGFAEFVFEHDGNGFVLDLERLWIERTFNDLLQIGVGRFHTPLGYWNRTYHHGALIYDTVSRPSFLEFEDGDSAILPVHIVGVMATGEKQSDKINFGYELYIANGPSINTDANTKPEIDINNVSDPDDEKSLGLRVILSQNSIPLQIGLFGMLNTVAKSSDSGSAGVGMGDKLVSQNIFGLDLKYNDDKLDVMAEYYNLDNKDKVGSSGRHTGTAYYAQVGYRVTDSLKPVYRYESLVFDTDDSYFSLLETGQEVHHVLGLRYDIDYSNTLKVEVNRTEPADDSNFTTYSLQWAWVMP